MDEAATRAEIKAALNAGLKAEVYPRADTAEQLQQIGDRLRGAFDLKQKLSIGGFTLKPVDHGGVEQACSSCTNFLVHKRFCERPELQLPVEPEWSCRLWRL